MKLATGSLRSQSGNFAGRTRRVAHHFVDTSHVTYYGYRRSATRQLVVMDASAGAWQPPPGGRRARMQKHIEEVSQLLNSLEEGGQKLASYDLLASFEEGVSDVQKNLPSFDLQLNDFSGSSASSTSESSSSEMGSSAMRMRKTTAAAASTAGIGLYDVPLCQRQHHQPQIAVAQPAIERATITVCQGKHCRTKGSQEMLSVLQSKGAEHGIHVSGCKCLKQCERAPAVRVESADNERAVTYVHVGNGALNHVITAALDEF